MDSLITDSSEQRSAVRDPVPGAISTKIDSEEKVCDAGVVRPNDPAPTDSASPRAKRSQERRRKPRKTLPEPPVPAFIMVSPGRYIRAEEPSANVTALGGGDADPTLEAEDSAASPNVPDGDAISDGAEGNEDALADNPSSDAQEEENRD